MTFDQPRRSYAALVMTVAAGLAGCCGSDKARGPAGTAAELQPVQHAADVPIVPPQPGGLPRPPEKVPTQPPRPDKAPPEKAPPEKDPIDDANNALREQNRELQRQLERRAAEVAPATLSAGGQVKHLVVLWLKKPGDKDGRKALLDARDTIRSVPGVVDVSAGECLPSDRPVVDSTYDVAVVITFKDEQALKAYGPHPTHQKLLKDVLGPIVEKYVVYDFVSR